MYQPPAERLLRKVLTDDVYDALVASLPDDDVDAESAARAECLLALRHSLSVLGMRILDGGGLSKMVGHGDFQEELAGPISVQHARKALYTQAMELIQDLIPDDEDEDNEFSGNGFSLMATDPHETYF